MLIRIEAFLELKKTDGPTTTYQYYIEKNILSVNGTTLDYVYESDPIDPEPSGLEWTDYTIVGGAAVGIVAIVFAVNRIRMKKNPI